MQNIDRILLFGKTMTRDIERSIAS